LNRQEKNFQTNDNGIADVVISLGEEISDVDGNVYGTVRIGSQIWMSENLNTIPQYGESWCYNGQENYCDTYGRLYNWEAIMDGSVEAGSQGICPNGWHVPTDEEWYLLESSFATGFCSSARLDWGCYPAGVALKTSSWGGDNSSMFSVLPAGYIDREGRSSLLSSYSYFWTSSKLGDSVWRRVFLSNQDNILRSTEKPDLGYSLRCIKD